MVHFARSAIKLKFALFLPRFKDFVLAPPLKIEMLASPSRFECLVLALPSEFEDIVFAPSPGFEDFVLASSCAFEDFVLVPLSG